MSIVHSPWGNSWDTISTTGTPKIGKMNLLSEVKALRGMLAKFIIKLLIQKSLIETKIQHKPSVSPGIQLKTR